MRPIPEQILITGTVRNGAETLESEIKRLQAAFGCMEDIFWFVAESDSTDNTLTVLSKLAKSIPNFRFKACGNLSATMPMRTERIAHCRNICLEEIRTFPAYQNLEYVAVADLDNMNNLLTAEGVKSCWQNDNWDACFANQKGPYYDIWALRHPAWSPNDCWQQSAFLKQAGVRASEAKFASIYARMITLPANADWVEVDSAFGGLGIYRRSSMIISSYAGKTDSGTEICEHVPFHAGLRANGSRLFINPKLINTEALEHTGGLRKQRSLRYKIKLLFR